LALKKFQLKSFKLMKIAHYLLAFILLAPAMLFAQTKEITLQDVYASRKFSPKGVYGLYPMNNGEYYCVLEKDSINVYNYVTGKKEKTLVTETELVPAGDTVPIPLGDYTFSKDEKQILIPAKTEYLYRYSSESDFYIWNLESKQLTQLSPDGKQRLAEFSPDGNKVAFVRDNNLFVKDMVTNIEYTVTHDGEQNKIINGTTDWVYEEEFAITKGFYWSPDSKRIAFYRFDESGVREFSMEEWGNLYPEVISFKYPKAGENNSLVTVHIYDLASQLITNVDLGPETDQYIPRIMWTRNPETLAFLRLNRLQNFLELMLADAKTGESTMIYNESNQYYIEESHFDHFMFLNNNAYLYTSEKDGWYRIYYNANDGMKPVTLTTENWDIADIYGIDEAKGLVYFSAAKSSPINRELLSVDLKGKVKQLSDDPGTYNPEFNSTYTYYISSYSTINTPPLYTVNKANGKQIRVMEENTALKAILADYNFQKVEFFTFTTSEGVELNGLKLLPPNFDAQKKYPVLFDIYGGPGSQTVVNRWGTINAWHQMLAQRGYIVVSVDNRGTGFRGERFKKMTYLNLGKYETLDQIEAAKYFASQSYVDPKRIGVWGWSYGGYMSTSCITQGADYFSTAIAVAPVTNWRYYDNIYTERFMRAPKENAKGYDENSPIFHVSKLKGKYLLIHGTGDDNVHVQNSMDLISALIKENKQFDLMLYPNKNHGIYGGNTRMHLFTLITDYILENL
jgi:dipeptidyl-peptidase-4